MNNEYAAIPVVISTFHKKGFTAGQINFTRKDSEGILKDAIAQNANDFLTNARVQNISTTLIPSGGNLVFDTLSQSGFKPISFY